MSTAVVRLKHRFGHGITKYPTMPESVRGYGCGYCTGNRYLIADRGLYGDNPRISFSNVPRWMLPPDTPFRRALRTFNGFYTMQECANLCALLQPSRPFGTVRNSDRRCECSPKCQSLAGGSNTAGQTCNRPGSSNPPYMTFRNHGIRERFSRPVPSFKPIDWISSKGSGLKVTSIHIRVPDAETCAQFAASYGGKYFRYGGVTDRPYNGGESEHDYRQLCVTMAPGTKKAPATVLFQEKASCTAKPTPNSYYSILTSEELESLEDVSASDFRTKDAYKWAKERTREGCATLCFEQGYSSFFIHFTSNPRPMCRCGANNCERPETVLSDDNCCDVYHITETRHKYHDQYFSDEVFEHLGLPGYYERSDRHHIASSYRVGPYPTDSVTGAADKSRGRLGTNRGRLSTSDFLYDPDVKQECANRCAAGGSTGFDIHTHSTLGELCSCSDDDWDDWSLGVTVHTVHIS